MDETIKQLIQDYGYLMVMLLIAVENVFPPIPSEVILTFSGYCTTWEGATMQIWAVVLSATVGALLGALVLYAVGRLLSVERLESILDGRVGRILHLKSEDVRKAQRWFDRRGYMTVFFCRFIPIVRSLISIPAGMAKMKLPLFLLLTTVGTLIWNTVLVILGKLAGDSWEKISNVMGEYSKVGLIVLVVLGVAAIVTFYVVRRKKEKAAAKSEDDDAE